MEKRKVKRIIGHLKHLKPRSRIGHIVHLKPMKNNGRKIKDKNHLG